MNIQEMYGGGDMGDTMPTPLASKEKSIEVKFTQKEKQEPMPINAKIKSTKKEIEITEIDNGFLIETETYTEYTTLEDAGGDMKQEKYGYHKSKKCMYSKDRPQEAILLYGLVK